MQSAVKLENPPNPPTVSVTMSEHEIGCFGASNASNPLNASNAAMQCIKGPVLQIIPSDSHLIRTKMASVSPGGLGMEREEEAFAEQDVIRMAVNDHYEISTTLDSSSHFRRIPDSEQERLMIAPNDSTSEDSKYYSYGTGDDGGDEDKDLNEEVIYFDDDDDDDETEEQTMIREDDGDEHGNGNGDGNGSDVDPDLDEDVVDSEFEREEEDMVVRTTSLNTYVRSESARSPTIPRHERNVQQLSELQGIF